jgi:hypothetical protein
MALHEAASTRPAQIDFGSHLLGGRRGRRTEFFANGGEYSTRIDTDTGFTAGTVAGTNDAQVDVIEESL